MISKLLQNINYKKIENIFNLCGGTTPLTTKKEYWNGDILWATPTDITKLNNSYLLKDTKKKITDKAVQDNALKLIEPGTLLMSSRASIGWTIIPDKKVTINQGITALIPKNQNEIHVLFYYYYFRFIRNLLNSLASGSTFKEISKSTLRNLHIPIPPLPTQKKIAVILSTADSAIQKVDEAIEKTHRLKKGVMHRLLTKGIGHTEFKDTEIGRIPKEWEVMRLKEVASIRGNRINKKLDEYAFIPMELLPENELFAKYLIKGKQDIKSYTYCESGDVLLAKITPSLENGKQGIVPEDIPEKVALATTEVFPIQCENIYNGFLFYILKMAKYRNVLITSMIGTTGRQRASKDVLEKLNIPVPSLREQKRIFEILQTIDKRLESLNSKKQKLQRIKQGLMNELLTGKKVNSK